MTKKATFNFTIYRVYYGDDIVYLGRTKQPLQDRIRGHVFKKPMHRDIDINHVTKIEYATFATEADMNVYEVYFINLYKPIFNCDDKALDSLSVSLPDVKWVQFVTPLWSKWAKKVADKDAAEKLERKRKIEFDMKKREMRQKWHAGEIAESEYYEFLDGGELT